MSRWQTRECVGGGSRAHVEVLAQKQNRQRRAKTSIWNSRCSQAQINKLTTLHRRNMTFVIQRQLSDFKSDTIQTTSENRALPTNKSLFDFLFAILQNDRTHCQLLLRLLQCLKVKAGALHKRNNVFFLHLVPLEGLCHNGKKRKRNSAV